MFFVKLWLINGSWFAICFFSFTGDINITVSQLNTVIECCVTTALPSYPLSRLFTLDVTFRNVDQQFWHFDQTPPPVELRDDAGKSTILNIGKNVRVRLSSMASWAFHSCGKCTSRPFRQTLGNHSEKWAQAAWWRRNVPDTLYSIHRSGMRTRSW